MRGLNYPEIIILGLIYPTWGVGYLGFSGRLGGRISKIKFGIKFILCLVKDLNLSQDKFIPSIKQRINLTQT